MAFSASDAKPLTSQVGGHAGVLATEDGSLIIKPALPLELEFYQAVQQSVDLEPLRPFIPKFLGMLKLEGQMDENKSAEVGNISVTPIDAPQKESLVLENISHPFLKPNILDIKLGTVLYDEDAPAAKVERMIETAKATTSFETGIRLTGFQVYDNTTSEPVNTPKSYGKSIKPADLPNGIARVFPVGAMPTRDSAAASASGLPLTTLLPLLRGIREDVEEIKGVYAELEMRMIGASLLIVYEADWERAEEGLKRLEQDEDDDEDEDEEDEEDDEEFKRVGPPYIVKLIDFAHTRLTPGRGPDHGVLLGMDTLLKLIDGRIAQLE